MKVTWIVKLYLPTKHTRCFPPTEWVKDDLYITSVFFVWWSKKTASWCCWCRSDQVCHSHFLTCIIVKHILPLRIFGFPCWDLCKPPRLELSKTTLRGPEMCSRLCCCIIFTLRPNLRGKVEPTDVEMVETTTEPKGCDFQQDVDYTFVGGARD